MVMSRVGITLGRIINITADLTLIFLHVFLLSVCLLIPGPAKQERSRTRSSRLGEFVHQI